MIAHLLLVLIYAFLSEQCPLHVLFSNALASYDAFLISITLAAFFPLALFVLLLCLVVFLLVSSSDDRDTVVLYLNAEETRSMCPTLTGVRILTAV